MNMRLFACLGATTLVQPVHRLASAQHALPLCSAAIATQLTAARWQGYDDSRDVRVHEVLIERERFLSPSFALFGAFGVVRTSGQRAGNDVGAMGGDASIHLVWRFACTARWSAQFTHGHGIAWFDPAFPPGGTPWNGHSSFGIDATTALNSHLSMTLGARHHHVSNGRGLVPRNPAFNGLGAQVGLAYLDSRRLAPRPLLATPDSGARVAAVRLAQIEGTWGTQRTDDTYVGASARANARISSALEVQLDGVRGHYRGQGDFTSAGAALFHRDARGLVGLAYSNARFDVFRSNQVLVVGERYADDLLTVVGAAGREAHNGSDDVIVAELFLRLYPHADLMLSSGVSWANASSSLIRKADLLWRVEYEPNVLLHRHGSLFFELRNKDQEVAAGVRIFPGAARALRTRHRRDALVGVR